LGKHNRKRQFEELNWELGGGGAGGEKDKFLASHKTFRETGGMETKH